MNAQTRTNLCARHLACRERSPFPFLLVSVGLRHVLTVMSLRARIDNAFYTALDPQKPSHDHVEAPGGFLLDDNPGGFLPPSPPAAGHEAGHGPERDEGISYIPLSRIPHALQLLDLPPDDEEVLAVFRNAATGWEDDVPSRRSAHRRKHDPTTTSEDNDMTEGRISLRDWRAVCAAVMGEDGDDEDDREGSSASNGDEILDAIGEDSSSPELEESSGGSSDEYRITETRSRKRSRKPAAATGGGAGAGAGATRKTRARKTQSATTRRRSPLSPSTSAEITPRQQRECLKAFLLFFPGVPEEEAQRRRLGVREVNAAATVLKEKIKTEEVRPLTLGLRTMVRMTFADNRDARSFLDFTGQDCEPLRLREDDDDYSACVINEAHADRRSSCPTSVVLLKPH
jgi:hypothetical protein